MWGLGDGHDAVISGEQCRDVQQCSGKGWPAVVPGVSWLINNPQRIVIWNLL